MVDACAAAGIKPFYGPFGDFSDAAACEVQFRNSFLLGCVGAWTLHPSQIAIAKKVYAPDPAEVAFAKKIVESMPDGAGAVSETCCDDSGSADRNKSASLTDIFSASMFALKTGDYGQTSHSCSLCR